MGEYVTLLGAEEVGRAASSMREAAAQMSSAASSIDWANQQQRQFMDDWLVRFEAAVAALTAALPNPTGRGDTP